MSEERRISLGGHEFEEMKLLEAPGAERADTPAAEALRRFIAEQCAIGPFPASGWRLVDESDSHAVFVAPQEHSNGWHVLEVVQRVRGAWDCAGSTHGQHPERTRQERGRGLGLIWGAQEYVTEQGEAPVVTVLLGNVSNSRWRGSTRGLALVDVFDAATGQRVKPTDPALRLSAEGHDLGPGESTSLEPVFATEHVDDLPPGLFDLVARVWSLALVSDPARLEVRPRAD